MEIAGYFHDIGKMAVPTSVIYKKGKLSDEEWALMKTQTFYSYYVLTNITEIPEMKEWSAFQHDTLDEFNIGKSKLSLGARILAVADILTALTGKELIKI